MDEQVCDCGKQLHCQYERNNGQCNDCKWEEDRFLCSNGCGERLIMIKPGEVNFCSEKCEDQFYDSISRL